jgi:intracellular sulfur oxidation DsrE/DsrF family protein
MRWTLGGAIGALVSGSVRELGAAPAAGDAWLDAIAAKKHKVFLDVGLFATDAAPFRRTKALLRILQENYGASDREIGVAFGAHGSGLGFMLRPAAWDKFGLIEHIAGSNLRAAEVHNLRNATRNWGTLGADNVAELQQRGVKFLACQQTIGRWAEKFAGQRGGMAAGDMVKEIIGSLHAGVEPVPAMIASAVLAQERKLSYVAIS